MEGLVVGRVSAMDAEDARKLKGRSRGDSGAFSNGLPSDCIHTL